MAAGRYIAYYRVSTERQGRSGLGLEAQRKAVLDFLNGGRWKLVEEYTEVESGKRADRPQLGKALLACRLHNATLVIAKLDRLSRNVAFIAQLMDAGVDFVAADMPQANRLTVHILAAMAEHEREAISARTKAALAQAKARGVKLGGNPENLRNHAAKAVRASVEARQDAARKRAADVADVIVDLKRQGAASLRQIAAGLNEREIRTTRGHEWTAIAVSRVLKQFERSAVEQGRSPG